MLGTVLERHLAYGSGSLSLAAKEQMEKEVDTMEVRNVKSIK